MEDADAVQSWGEPVPLGHLLSAPAKSMEVYVISDDEEEDVSLWPLIAGATKEHAIDLCD
jgi:hypothetical protein